MAPPNTRVIDGKKFLWDGRNYADEAEARAAAEAYERDRFEAKGVEEGGACFVYTRRLASAEG